MALGACLPVSQELSVRALSGRKPRLVGRWCLLTVSCLKQAQLQLAPHNAKLPGWNTKVLPFLLRLGHLAAYAGLGAARGLSFANTVPGQAKLAIQMANVIAVIDASPSWLALSGRGLATAGRALALAVPFLQGFLDREGSLARSGHQVVTMRKWVIHDLWVTGLVVEWLTHQLALLASAQEQGQQQQGVSAFWARALGATRSATQAVDEKVLRKLQKQVGELRKQLQPLHAACTACEDSSSSAEQQIAALSAHIEACGEGGWLPAALQELGEALVAAFPHKWACNDPACVNMAALTEMSAAKKACTDCKVRPCGAKLRVEGVVVGVH